jgi:hypothetical protein
MFVSIQGSMKPLKGGITLLYLCYDTCKWNNDFFFYFQNAVFDHKDESSHFIFTFLQVFLYNRLIFIKFKNTKSASIREWHKRIFFIVKWRKTAGLGGERGRGFDTNGLPLNNSLGWGRGLSSARIPPPLHHHM